jgi:hypothetical protein
MNEIEQLTSAVLKLTRAVHGMQKELEGRFNDLDVRIRSTERMMNPMVTMDLAKMEAQVASKPEPWKIWKKEPWPVEYIPPFGGLTKS